MWSIVTVCAGPVTELCSLAGRVLVKWSPCVMVVHSTLARASTRSDGDAGWSPVRPFIRLAMPGQPGQIRSPSLLRAMTRIRR